MSNDRPNKYDIGALMAMMALAATSYILGVRYGWASFLTLTALYLFALAASFLIERGYIHVR